MMFCRSGAPLAAPLRSLCQRCAAAAPKMASPSNPPSLPGSGRGVSRSGHSCEGLQMPARHDHKVMGRASAILHRVRSTALVSGVPSIGWNRSFRALRAKRLASIRGVGKTLRAKEAGCHEDCRSRDACCGFPTATVVLRRDLAARFGRSLLTTSSGSKRLKLSIQSR
jgi:hypothetical protein